MADSKQKRKKADEATQEAEHESEKEGEREDILEDELGSGAENSKLQEEDDLEMDAQESEDTDSSEQLMIGLSEEEFDLLQLQVKESQSLAEEYLDGWQRSKAEFQNYKKRIEKERDQFYHNKTAEILIKYLEVLDDLNLALKDKPGEGDDSSWADGIELVYRKLQGILEAEGVEQIETDGQIFDPHLHEAISHEESEEHGSDQIIEVLKQGYRLGDRILRPAVVRVAR
jgi:molecular chaperone GrpE